MQGIDAGKAHCRITNVAKCPSRDTDAKLLGAMPNLLNWGTDAMQTSPASLNSRLFFARHGTEQRLLMVPR